MPLHENTKNALMKLRSIYFNDFIDDDLKIIAKYNFWLTLGFAATLTAAYAVLDDISNPTIWIRSAIMSTAVMTAALLNLSYEKIKQPLNSNLLAYKYNISKDDADLLVSLLRNQILYRRSLLAANLRFPLVELRDFDSGFEGITQQKWFDNFMSSVFIRGVKDDSVVERLGGRDLAIEKLILLFKSIGVKIEDINSSVDRLVNLAEPIQDHYFNGNDQKAEILGVLQKARQVFSPAPQSVVFMMKLAKDGLQRSSINNHACYAEKLCSDELNKINEFLTPKYRGAR